MTKPCSSKLFVFLSTPSARRATKVQLTSHKQHQFLSTPSARRATGASGCEHHNCSGFLSTPSARRATCYDMAGVVQRPISIHALREEGDLAAAP